MTGLSVVETHRRLAQFNLQRDSIFSEALLKAKIIIVTDLTSSKAAIYKTARSIAESAFTQLRNAIDQQADIREELLGTYTFNYQYNFRPLLKKIEEILLNKVDSLKTSE